MTIAVSPPTSTPLLKEHLAALLREQIIQGHLAPGERIVEGRWAAQFEVSQGSVREALNILAAEGFVQKGAGHSARVTKLTAEDVTEIYQLRARLEGFAAGLLARNVPDLKELEESIAHMHQAANTGDMTALIDNDLRFHMLLCQTSGNRFLVEHARRLLVPLFAFVQMRVHTNKQGPEPWKAIIPVHRQILDAIRLGDPFLAEQFVMRTTLLRFGNFAYEIWENRPIGGSPPVPQAGEPRGPV